MGEHEGSGADAQQGKAEGLNGVFIHECQVKHCHGFTMILPSKRQTRLPSRSDYNTDL